MNMMQAAQRRREDEKGKELDASPVKTVLGSLNQAKQDKDPVHKLHRNKISPKKPHSIEDVPFRIEDVPMRRQDKRILNARNRRLNDRRLIICIVLTGVIFLLLGVAALAVFMSFTNEPDLKPLIVIGPILIGCGILTCLCSIEVCVRLYVSKKRTADPELDNLVNPHEVKHWMAPELIPYGWGFFVEGKGIVDLADRGRVGAGAPEHNHPHIMEHQDSQVVIQLEDTLEEADQYIDDEGETLNNTLVDFPHRIMAVQEAKRNDIDDHPSSDPLLDSDIYSSSLRFSHLSRPAFQIDRSSPIPQMRGEFEDTQERIANLFQTSRNGRRRPNTS